MVKLTPLSLHEMAPPRQRPRLALSLPEAPDTGEPPQVAPQDPQPGADPQASQPPEIPAAQLPPVPMSPGSLSQISQEPSEEPPIPSGQPTPHAAPDKPELHPQTAALYEAAGPETFQQRRLRFSQQETLSFAPWRTRHQHQPAPYGPAPEHEHVPQTAAAAEASATQTATPITGEQPPGQAFQVEDLDPKLLPAGWHVDEEGYISLNDRPTDYWEVKAGCLIRHHLVPRRGKMNIDNLPKDCPVPVAQLDRVKVTLIHQQGGGKGRLMTDDGTDTQPPKDLKSSWTGVTVFQINGTLRKEMAMHGGHHQTFTSAKQEAKSQKLARVKKMKTAKNDVNERHLGPHERAMFKEAKVKELKSFFDHGVWTFQTKSEADEARTLTSRIILKWSKHPDGSPRAKARLIVRGYNDPDALAGQIPTSSPTTTRLSRSIVLSLAANLNWNMWTADVSTAFLQGRCQDRKLWVKLPNEALQLRADQDTRMLLLKPCYGQIDAPRGWYLEAVDRLLRAGLRQHPLDPCAFLIYESDSPDYKAEDPIYEEVSSLGPERLCGMVIMHVHDMLGAGCPRSPRYKAVTDLLRENFSFREWKEEELTLEYCGCQLEKTEAGGRRLHQEPYMGKIKPISFSKGRPMSDYLLDKEITQVRGLLGSLQWPGVQTSPHLQCSTSMLAGQITKATVQTLHECNRLLKFAKENKDVSLHYNRLCHPDELQLLCFFDAGFTARTDGSSQGGYITCWSTRPCFPQLRRANTMFWTGAASAHLVLLAAAWALRHRPEARQWMQLISPAVAGTS